MKAHRFFRKNIFAWLAAIVILAIVFVIGYLYKSERLTFDKQAAPVSDDQVQQLLSGLSLSFQENRGQVDEVVKFLVKNQGQTIFFAPDHVMYALTRRISQEEEDIEREPRRKRPENRDDEKVETLAIKQVFNGANKNSEITSEAQMPGVVNYLLGNDPTKWQKNVPTYERIRYNQLYEGIDLVYSGKDGALKFDYHVAPNADPSPIGVSFEGIDRLRIAEDGSLALVSDFGDIGIKKPEAYQMINGEKVPVEVEYQLNGILSYGFKLGSYDPAHELVIDPRVYYSTYLGGNANDYAYSVQVDDDGNAYIAGETYSTNWFSVAGHYDETFGGSRDAFVVKINSTATSPVIYSTYLGGAKSDLALDIVLLDSGELIIGGWTNSQDFPTTVGAYDTTPSDTLNTDGFITKLSADGNSLSFSTAFGGDLPETIRAVAVDDSGSIYITGSTGSSEDMLWGNFPISLGVYDSTYNGGDSDVFVAKMNSAGSALLFATYLGGEGVDAAYDIALDSSNTIYIAGETRDATFPTTAGRYMAATENSSSDAFIARFDSTGSSLMYSSALGVNTASVSFAYGIAANDSGEAVIAGYTTVSGFPTVNAYDNTYNGGQEAFIAKFNTNSSGAGSLLFSTYVGGAEDESFSAVTLDASGNIYAVGASSSDDFPTTADAIWTKPRAFTDILLTKLSSDGDLIFSSFYVMSGGYGYDSGGGLFVDDNEVAYIVGSTNSGGMATSGVIQPTHRGGSWDGIIIKASTKNEAPSAPVLVSPSNGANVISLTPSLVANFRDFDAKDSGLIHVRVSSGTTTDCVNDINIVFSGSSQVVSAFTDATVVSGALVDGNSYAWCAQGDDEDLTGDWTPMGTFTVDLVEVISYGTFLGGSGQDIGNAIGFDTNGNPVVMGRTSSTNFPMVNPIQATNPGSDHIIFITKLDSTAGTALVSTYLGGNSDDYPSNGAVDENGNVYIGGASYASDTFSTKYPGVIQGFDTTPDTDLADVYVVKLNEDIDTVLFTTYVGGSDYEDFWWFGGLSVHPTNGRVAITGITYSSDFVLTPNAFDTVGDGPDESYNGDAFITIIDTTQSGAASLVYSSYVGGSGFDESWTTVFDENGHVYVTGDTCSADFVTTAGAFDTTVDDSNCDAFLIRIDPNGTNITSLAYSTMIGGSNGWDYAYGVAMGPDGDVFTCGETNSSDFPTTAGAYATSLSGAGDAFVMKFNTAGNGNADLSYGTLIGDVNNDWCIDLRVHTDGVVYFQGKSNSLAFPTTDGAFSSDPLSLVIVKLHPGSQGADDLIYSTYFGSTGTDNGMGVALDDAGNFYITGNTNDPNFPSTAGVFQSAKSGGADAYFVKLALAPENIAPSAPIDLYSNNDSAQAGASNPAGIADTTPAFSAICRDGNPGDIMNLYQIQVDDQNDFSSTIWDSGALGTAMADCVAGSRSQDIHYGGDPLLLDGTTYYWRIRFWDDEGLVGVWSEDPLSTNAFTMAVPNTSPSEPTDLYVDDTDAQQGSANPTGILHPTPAFSAICNDNVGDTLNKYRIQVDNDNDFSSVLWDSGASGTAMADCASGARSADITYGGTPLADDGATYYWRIKFWDDEGTEGPFSTEEAMFTMGDGYDGFATYFGGNANDQLLGIGLDTSDNIIMIGTTFSADFPADAGLQEDLSGMQDGILAKLSADGSSVLVATYFGGSDHDPVRAGRVDASGNVYIAGATSSADVFATHTPNTSGFDMTYSGNDDVYLAKLNADLDEVLFGTYVGGSGEDEMGWKSMRVDDNGIVYLAGRTTSADLPLTGNAFDSTGDLANNDGFIMKIDTNETGMASLLYSTYVGGSGNDLISGINFDDNGNIYIAGETASADFPALTAGAFDTTVDTVNADGFVLKIDPTGTDVTSLVYGTIVGSDNDYDGAYDVVAESPSGDLFVCGMTYDPAFVTTAGSFDETHNGSGDMFIYQLTLGGNGADDLVYGSFLGGAGDGWCTEMTLDGDTLVFSGSYESGFPVTDNAYQDINAGSFDYVAGRFAPEGNGACDLVYASYFGGSGEEYDQGATYVADTNVLYVAGETTSSDMPVSGGYFSSVAFGGNDGFGFSTEIPSSAGAGCGGGGGGGGGSSIQRIQTQSLSTPTIVSVRTTGHDRVQYEWGYSTTGHSGFYLLDQQQTILEIVNEAQVRTVVESGLPHNTLIEGRRVAAFVGSTRGTSSQTFPSVYTHMTSVTLTQISRVDDRIRVGVTEELNHLTSGQSAVQFELMPADSVSGSAIIASDWIQASTYVFENTDRDQAYYARVRARNYDGVETDWSNNVMISAQEFQAPIELLVDLQVTTADGRSISGPVNPNELLYVKAHILNNGALQARNVLLTVPLPPYLSYIPGSLRVNGVRNSEIPDGDAGQFTQETVAGIWPTLDFGFGHTLSFILAFDTQSMLRDFLDDDSQIDENRLPKEPLRAPVVTREDLFQLLQNISVESGDTSEIREALAAAGPQLQLQAIASEDSTTEPTYSNIVVAEPELNSFVTTEDVVEEPVAPPTKEEVVVIEDILQPDKPSQPTQPSPQVGNTDVTTGPGTFELETQGGTAFLGVSGNAVTNGDGVEFSGTTTEPFTTVTIIINDTVTMIVTSDASGQWRTFVSADDIGLLPGQSRQIRVEAIAAKGELRSEQVVVGLVNVTRLTEDVITTDFTDVDVKTTGFIGAVQQVQQVIEEQQQTIQTSLSVTAPVVLVASAPLWGYLPYVPTLLYHFFTYLIGLLGRKKKQDRRFYGTVYDSITKQPLALAIIRIYNKETNKLVSTQVSDKQGRYEALLEPANYRLEVTKPTYTFPSQIVTSEIGGNYHAYSNEQGIIVQEQDLVIPDVPLDPVNAQRQWQLSSGLKKLWMLLQKVGNYLAVPVLFIGSLASILVVITVPDNWINWLLAIVYVGMLSAQLELRVHAQKAWGVVYDLATNAVLPLATVQLIDPQYGKVVTSRLTDYQGRYSFMPEPGKYVIKANKPGYEQVREVVEAPDDQHHPIPPEIEVQKTNERITGDVPMTSRG